MTLLDNDLAHCDCHYCTHIRAGMGPGTIGWNPKPTPEPEKLQSCKGHSDQVFCNDPNCGRRDEQGFHYRTGDPRNKFVPAKDPRSATVHAYRAGMEL